MCCHDSTAPSCVMQRKATALIVVNGISGTALVAGVATSGGRGSTGHSLPNTRSLWWILTFGVVRYAAPGSPELMGGCVPCPDVENGFLWPCISPNLALHQLCLLFAQCWKLRVLFGLSSALRALWLKKKPPRVSLLLIPLAAPNLPNWQNINNLPITEVGPEFGGCATPCPRAPASAAPAPPQR